MQTKTRFLTCIVIGLLGLSSSARAEEKVLLDLNLDAALAGDPAPTAPFDPAAVSHSMESKNVTDSNKIEVAKDLEGFPGGALRFIKGSPEPRTPCAIFVNRPGLLTSGKVKFTWNSQIDSFAASEKFPGFEALLSFVLRDSVGTPFFHVYYLMDSNKTEGVFGCNGKRVGSWKLGTKQAIEVVLDLDAGTGVVKVDGAQIGDEQKFTTNGGLRVVQIGDGTGFAFYGSKFAATLGGFKLATF